MKLYTYEADGKTLFGAEKDGGLVDLTGVAPDLLSLIRGGEAKLEEARGVLRDSAPRHRLSEVRIRVPMRPGKILCSGVNYTAHALENPNAKMPTEPFFFAKLPSSVIGPGEAIRKGVTEQLDYEVEFSVVIGKPLAVGTAGEAVMDAIFGYTLLNDVSARDVQFKDNQITLGKNLETFAPIAPGIVTKDEIPDPNNVALRTTLNGKVLQDGSTSDWLFKLPVLVGHVLKYMPLEPGDIVTTGTPAGVGLFQQPQVFMKPGDVVIIEAEGIGRLENPVVA
ncbi:MAG: FAA hydrolase family protein [Meiothermus sp.]